jgi:hypothetical protein
MKSGPVSSHKDGQAENLVRMEAALDELAVVRTQQDAWTGAWVFKRVRQMRAFFHSKTRSPRI